MIEFALILPVFLVLTVGVIELSNAFMAFNNLNKSVRDGIGYMSRHAINATNNAVANPLDATEVARTQNLIAQNFNTTLVALDHQLQNGDIHVDTQGTNHIKIYATYTYNLFLGRLLNNLAGLIGGGFSTNIPMTASAVYRVI